MDAVAPLPALDESFSHRYQAVARERLETPDELRFYPRRPTLIVEVVPHGWRKSWSGVFGEDESGYATGLFTTPSPDTLCVVSGGAGYFVVAAEDEGAWSRVECTPVRFVLPFTKHGLLVFGDFIAFVAYRWNDDCMLVPLEIAWRSARLGYDDLTVTGTSEDRIEGQAWNAPEGRAIGFSLDVATGKHAGGAYEWLG